MHYGLEIWSNIQASQILTHVLSNLYWVFLWALWGSTCEICQVLYASSCKYKHGQYGLQCNTGLVFWGVVMLSAVNVCWLLKLKPRKALNEQRLLIPLTWEFLMFKITTYVIVWAILIFIIFKLIKVKCFCLYNLTQLFHLSLCIRCGTS